MLTKITQPIGEAWARRARAILPWLIGLAFVAVEIRRVAGQVAARYPDFFAWAERAAAFDLHNLARWDWVNGLYPLGYPLLLRLGVALGLDVLQTAFALSILGGFLGLMSTFWLARRLTGNWTLAVLSQLALACMSYYLFFANLDATDMFAAGLLLCSLVLLLSETNRRWTLFASGLLAGFSYLIRYTASQTILLCVLFLLGVAIVRRQREKFLEPVIYLLGAGIGAAPQLIASLLIEGNPFYNHQAHNLWFHLTGSSDYIYAWNSVPMDISLREVVSADPARFFSHWWKVFRSAWFTGDAVTLDPPLGPLTHAGFLFLVLVSGALRRRARVFVALYVVGFIALLSFVRLDRRFLITLMPFQVLGCLCLLWRLLPAKVQHRRLTLPVRVPILLLLLVTNLRYPLRFMVSNPRDEQVVEVRNVLYAAGAESMGDVFGTQGDYQDVADPWKRRFDLAAFIARDQSSYEELLGFIRDREYKLFLFDNQEGPFLYPDLEWVLHPENRPAGLSPVYVPDERRVVIYRVEGEQWPQPHPVEAELENGIVLRGYEVYWSEDAPAGSGRRLGLYLHWEAQASVDKWLKVFVHVIDSNGQLVAQHDGVPALWTYPTNNWAVGERVVDFHTLPVDTTLGRGPFTIQVGLYDPGTGNRVTVLDPAGLPVDDHIVLETFD